MEHLSENKQQSENPEFPASEVFGEYWGKVHIPEDIMEPETDEWEDV